MEQIALIDVFTAQTGCFICEDESPPETSEDTQPKLWQVFADIREELKYSRLSMSGWQYGEHILAIYDCEQRFS